MRKLNLLLVIVIGLMISCEDISSEITVDDKLQTKEEQSEESVVSGRLLSGCQPNSGSATPYNKTGDYNCHAYVRGALVQKSVNLYTGEPGNTDYSWLGEGTIQADNNFIRVCSRSHADAIAHLPKSRDHSAIILSGGSYAYTFPNGNGGDIWNSGSALHYGTACDYEYYAAIPDVKISGPVKSGNDYTFTLQNAPSFITYDQNRWSYPSGFQVISKSNTQLVLRPNSGVSGTFQVSATLKTSALTGSCPKGINNIETATGFIPRKTKSFTVATDCSGTLDGGPLYTMNYVSKYQQHQVVMAASHWTWVKTSGNASWSTSNFGQQMTFSISSGSATFNAYRSGCNRTVTFYAY